MLRLGGSTEEGKVLDACFAFSDIELSARVPRGKLDEGRCYCPGNDGFEDHNLSYPPAASSRRTRGIIADLERDQDGFMKTGQANDAWRRIEIMMGLVMRCGTWQVVGTMGESSWTTGTFKNIDYEHNDRSYRFADSRGCNSRLMQVRRHMLCEFDPNLC